MSPGHVTTLAQARKLALALPEVTEEPHHDMASFRVRGKIFATVPDDTHLRVMVDEMEIRAAVAENPDVCEELYWGKRLACVVVNLRRAPCRPGGGTAHRRLDPQGTQEAGGRALRPLKVSCGAPRRNIPPRATSGRGTRYVWQLPRPSCTAAQIVA